MLLPVRALTGRWQNVGACALFVGSLGFFLFAIQPGWNTWLVEDQGFRQTQTAISAYYMLDQKPRLAYETPVFGPPWSIPFEFPLYQWIVAAVVTALHTPLDQTGRFVSVGFFLLTLFPANSILRQLHFTRSQRLMILSLMLLSPYYVYWSRTFLIESTALFFATSFLAWSMRSLRQPSVLSGIIAVLTGTIAGLVKITTLAPFLLAVSAYGINTAFSMYRDSRRWQNAAAVTVRFFLLVMPALVCAIAWTRFCDEQKTLNRIGHATTSAMLTTWNFGTWEQRLDVHHWSTIAGRYGLMIGDLAFLAVCVLGFLKSGRRWLIVAALLLAGSAPLIFTNLYIHHEYYPYATGLFLIAAVGMGLTALWEYAPWGRAVAMVALMAVIVTCGHRYYHRCYPRLAQKGTGLWLEWVVTEIQKQTDPDEVILVLGFDWSSEIPYYSRRRALMIPDWESASFLANPQPYLDDLRGHRLGGIVVANLGRINMDPVAVRHAAELAGMPGKGTRVHGHRFLVFSRHEPDVTTELSDTVELQTP